MQGGCACSLSKSHCPALPALPAAAVALQAACFLAFWTMQLGVLLRGMEGIRLLEKYRWTGYGARGAAVSLGDGPDWRADAGHSVSTKPLW